MVPEVGKEGVRERDSLYRMIISQLFYDGHQGVAVQLSGIINSSPACPPSDRLLHVVTLGLKAEEELQQQQKMGAPGAVKQEIPVPLSGGIDLEFQSEVHNNTPEPASYETCYVTSHKGPCRVGVFSPDGLLVATGSVDSSIKILDVERMLAKSTQPPEMAALETTQQSMENHPVIRTLYDHIEEVTALEFHPEMQMLASGGKDNAVKFFDFAKSSVKRAHKTIHEVEAIRCLSFHPSGDFLLVGTNHPTVRLYDVNTCQCYVGANPNDHHLNSVTTVRFSPNANVFVTGSKDGDIKIWDGVSNKCINTFKQAHEGHEICSAFFSRNSKYVLSSGKDSLVKLWELSTNRCLIAYTGAGTTGKQVHRTQAQFNHTEDYVMFPDEKTTSLCCWDSRNAARKQLLALGHNGAIRCLCHSPTGPAFLTCSDDYRARFWYKRANMD